MRAIEQRRRSARLAAAARAIGAIATGKSQRQT
jgi:hypothetical protein